jgi:hypothetical protein
MKGKLSLSTVAASAALAVAASAAPAASGPPRDWFERAAHAAILEGGATPYVEASQRRETVNRGIEVAPDWFERAAGAAIGGTSPTPSVDAVERREVPSVLSRTWPEVGIAFAIGLALGLTLALGLVGLMRFRPNRPLTQ